MFAGQAVSVCGDIAFDVVVALWLALVVGEGSTWAPVLAVLGVVSSNVPGVLFSVWGGAVADRYPPQLTMCLANGVQAVSMGAMIPLVVLHDQLSMSVVMLWAVAALTASNIAAQVFNPARLAWIARTIPATQRAEASSWSMSASAILNVVTPPVAVPVFVAVGPVPAFALNAASFMVSAALVWWASSGVQPPRRALSEPVSDVISEAGPITSRGIVEGFVTMWKDPVLTSVVGLLVAVTLGTGGLAPLLVFFVTGHLGLQASDLGWLLGLAGLFAVVGAVVAPVVLKNRMTPRTLTLLVAAAGAAVVAFATVPLPAVAIVFFVLAIALDAVSNVVVMPVILDRVPEHVTGRVVASITPLASLGRLTSVAVMAGLASGAWRSLDAEVLGVGFQTYNAVFALGGLCIVAGALCFGAILWRLPAGEAGARG